MSQETIVEFVYMPEDTIEFSETEEGHYEVAIAFFQSPSFYERVMQSPYYVNLDQELFVQATLQTSDPDLQLLVDTCEALPDPQNTTLQTYGLIRQGCVEDTTYQSYPSPSMDVARFSFRAFEFLKEHSSIYLRCKMAVCSVNDPSSFCTQGCFSRRKRSLGTPHQEVEVIVGPIQLLQ
ncbi:CUB and zona pellucida-like domain-containing protein 1 [Ambystoma mexicanum]|uniref:CUB and zona pellucida-like domain-containing protein 1 n=1 Tax=Ambystoma mexicanum TaxID=8296 RepID=UPI0037E9A8E3